MPDEIPFLPFEKSLQTQMLALILQDQTLYERYSDCWEHVFFKFSELSAIATAYFALKTQCPDELITPEILRHKVLATHTNSPHDFLNSLEGTLDELWACELANTAALEGMIADWVRATAVEKGILGFVDDVLRRRTKKVSEYLHEFFNIGKKKVPKFIGGPEFEDLEIPRPAVQFENLLHAAEIFMFSAESKAGKSLTFMDLAMSLAASVPWWNFQPGPKAQVVFCNLEVPAWQFQERYREIRQAKGLAKRDLGLFTPLNLCDEDIPDFTEFILKFIGKHHADAIVIDSFYNLTMLYEEKHGILAEDIPSFIKLLKELKSIRAQTGASVLFSHHYPKGNAAEKMFWDRYSGPGILHRFVTTLMSMTRHKSNKDGKMHTYWIETSTRHKMPIPDFGVRMEGPLYVVANELSEELAGSEENKKYSEFEILALLEPTGLSRKEWLERVKGHYPDIANSTFDTHVATLKKWNRITKTSHLAPWMPCDPNYHLNLIQQMKHGRNGDAADSPV